MSEWIGQKGKYRSTKKEPIGGGQGLVYEAHTESKERVAVKVAKGPDESVRLEEEKDALEHLHRDRSDLKDYIVRLIDWGYTEEGRFFLVLPWYNWDLKRYLERGGKNLAGLAPLNLEVRLKMAALACEAVQQLHKVDPRRQQGWIHRDIKPSNFLVDDSGIEPRVLLSDFGGAKQDQVGGLFSLGSGFHSNGYAPPDQPLPTALNAQPDRSWDLYALSITLFECLMGHQPSGARAASSCYTKDGDDLKDLAERKLQKQLDPKKEAKLIELAGKHVWELVALDKVRPFTKEDKTDLQERLERSLEEGVSDPKKLAKGFADAIETELNKSLRGSPEERLQGNAGRLHELCEGLLRQLREEQSRHAQTAASKPAEDPSEDLFRKKAPAPPLPPPAPPPLPRYHYAGPGGQREGTPEEITSWVHTAPGELHQVWKPGLSGWKDWQGLEELRVLYAQRYGAWYDLRKATPPKPPPLKPPEPPPVDPTPAPSRRRILLFLGGGVAAGVGVVSALSLVGGSLSEMFKEISDAVEPDPEPPPEPDPEPVPEEHPARWSGRFAGYEMARIPVDTEEGSKFWMGSEEGEPGRDTDETRHEVTLKRGYYLGVYEVDQELWKKLMSWSPSETAYGGVTLMGASLPVHQVSWEEAVKFCNLLTAEENKDPNSDKQLVAAYYKDANFTEKIGADWTGGEVYWKREANGYRLPTEAEWEYAARCPEGGEDAHPLISGWSGDATTDPELLKAPACTYGNVNNPSSKQKFGWTWDSFTCEEKGGYLTLAPVKASEFQPNKWGLYQMSGNVWEWCWDYYWTDHQKLGSVDPAGDTKDPAGYSYRVNRGGSGGTLPRGVRVANRGRASPSLRGGLLGLRLARSL